MRLIEAKGEVIKYDDQMKICSIFLNTQSFDMLNGEKATVAFADDEINDELIFVKRANNVLNLFITDDGDWNNANDFCEENGASLFFPPTKSAADWLMGKFNKQEMHIGLQYLDSQWVISKDTSLVPSIYWDQNHPLNPNTETCSMLKPGGVNSITCSSYHIPGICVV